MNLHQNINVAETKSALKLTDTALQEFPEGEDILMTTIKTKSSSLNIRYDNASTFNQPESITKDIDIKRDILTRCSFRFLEAYSEHPDPTKQQAALRIIERLRGKNYTDIINLPFASESLALEEIFRVLGEPSIVADLQILPEFKQSIDALKLVELEFQEVSLSEEQKKSENIHQENASDLRPIAIDFINNQVLRYAYLMEEINPATYGELARVLREIIKTTNQRLKTRQTLNEKAAEEERNETSEANNPNEGQQETSEGNETAPTSEDDN